MSQSATFYRLKDYLTDPKHQETVLYALFHFKFNVEVEEGDIRVHHPLVKTPADMKRLLGERVIAALASSAPQTMAEDFATILSRAGINAQIATGKDSAHPSHTYLYVRSMENLAFLFYDPDEGEPGELVGEPGRGFLD